MNARMYPLFGLLLLSLLSPARGANYFTSHSRLEEPPIFVLPAEVRGKVYLNPGLALEVVSVECDGVGIAPVFSEAIGDGDETCFTQEVHQVAYRWNFSEGRTRLWRDGKPILNQFVRFSLPRDAKIVTVKYIIHTADGKASEVMTLHSVERNAAKYAQNEQATQEFRKAHPEKARSR